MSKNTFSTAAERLRLLADEMDRYGNEPAPAEACGDIGAAARTLRQLGLKTSCIHLAFWTTGIGKDSSVDWSVWDGSEHHKGKTLAQAVEACRVAHTEPPEDAEVLVVNALAPAPGTIHAHEVLPY